MPAIRVGTVTSAAQAARRFIVSLSCNVTIDRFPAIAVATVPDRLVEALQVIGYVPEILADARA